MSDQRLVNLALKRGYITPLQLEAARRESQSLADRGIERSVSFILLDLGFLTDAQLAELRNSTSSNNIRALEVNGHVIEGRLGSGGMGDVFKARSKTGQAVAVKIMPMKFAQDEEYLFRFHREVNVMTSLQHPHITGFLDAGDIDGRLYLIMELIDGPNLKEHLLKVGHMDEDDVLLLLEQTASALHYAQSECGIIHRDMKPANVILGPPRKGVDEPFCAKLCDFGLAKLSSNVDAHEEGHLTKSGMAVGTPHYMSPEVATGEKFVDHRADIYGLAATAYHAITGKTMYTGRNSGIIMYQQATSRSTLRHWKERPVSSGMRALLEDMLAKDLFARIQDWETVLHRIEELRAHTRRHRKSDRVEQHEQEASRQQNIIQQTNGEASDAPLQRSQHSRRSLLQAMLLALCVLMIGAGLALLFFVGADRFQVRVLPNSFAKGLEQAKGEIQRQLSSGVPEPIAHIVLEPGVYFAPIILDQSCSYIKFHAAGPGVRIMPAAHAEHLPLIQCRSGVRDVHVHGVLLDHANAVAIEIEANAELSLSAVRIEATRGTVIDMRGTANIRGLRALEFGHGIHVHPGAQLTMSDSLLAGSGMHLRIDQGHAQLKRCRFQQTGQQATASLLSANGGDLAMEASVLHASSSETGISLDSVNNVQLQNVWVESSVVGMRSHDSRITLVSGLSIRAREIGLHWTGPWEVSWQWNGQLLDAPTPIQGDSLTGLPVKEQGANQKLLQSIPDAKDI